MDAELCNRRQIANLAVRRAGGSENDALGFDITRRSMVGGTGASPFSYQDKTHSRSGSATNPARNAATTLGDGVPRCFCVQFVLLLSVLADG